MEKCKPEREGEAAGSLVLILERETLLSEEVWCHLKSRTYAELCRAHTQTEHEGNTPGCSEDLMHILIRADRRSDTLCSGKSQNLFWGADSCTHSYIKTPSSMCSIHPNHSITTLACFLYCMCVSARIHMHIYRALISLLVWRLRWRWDARWDAFHDTPDVLMNN